MKKIVLLSFMVMCLPLAGMAQSFDDDLYYTPKDKGTSSEDRKTERTEEVKTTPEREGYVPAGAAFVVKDRKGNVRDVDEYNRRYDSSDNTFTMENDTLVIQEKDDADRGEWVNGFDGSEDDYEYAMRIVRFRNPRFAIPISSPLYWDVVYGVNSWDWNVYDDGFYAYAFPTYTNRLWWDWRFGSFGITWGFPYYSGYWGWGGYYPGYWGGYWGHHHGWYDPWYGHGHWGRPSYYDNRPSYYGGVGSTRPGGAVSSRPGVSSTRPSGSVSGTRPSNGRVVGTRPSTSSRPSASTRPSSSSGSISTRPSMSGSRVDGTSSNRSSSSGYTRSSSSRPSSSSSYNRSSSTRRSSSYTPSESSTRNSSYSRGSSSSSSTRPSYSGSSSRSFSSGSSGGSSRSSGSYSGGGSRSGGGSSRSSGGRR
ncbi:MULTISPECIES: hypothetical protein [unclassified Bacteroides]|uniref:hypothetical protein n=1 Tax=unclassified Bacteroides TaxID=2646097 RepID=UPI000E8EA644|nr:MULTISPECIES: hypothetical protein [unclassified Bacteroides]RGN44125.1 hypothetical protein DXB63_14710 [Bacteroides sp. OM05-12]RHR82303.1 hypothetical protein DWW69_02355 [Bacteroides sp. AF16-49]